MSIISVIVPVYNVEKYLTRCIESILSQTFTNFELILVDDGSPDNCGSICDAYAAEDDRIVVIHQENGGLSAARNAGIDWVFSNSDSQWITFIDSDDWIHPQMLEILLQATKDNNTAISICSYADTNGVTPVIDTSNIHCSKYQTDFFYCTHEINATVAWGKLYAKELYVHRRYPIGKIHEDEFLTYKLLFDSKEISYISTPLYFYYNNPSSIVRSDWTPRRLDALEALEERISYFEKTGNISMLEHSKKQLLSRSSLLYLQACANHKTKYFPKKYHLHFIKALHILEKYCGTDKYEMYLAQDYPFLIKTQAYYRKLKNLINAYIFSFPKRYNSKMALVCIAKYEAPYIKEWIDYHLMQGVDCIYLYDNDSPDKMAEILKPYIDNGKVIYTFFPGKARQLDAYNDAIRRFKYKSKYMAFLDCDEFLVQENPNKTLIDTIEQLMHSSFRCAGIAVNWRMYGSSGHIHPPKGSVIESYLFRGDSDSKGSNCIKTIANPRRIKKYNHVHYPTYYRGFYSINEQGIRCDGPFNRCKETEYIRINHYFTKSKEEWIERRSRGKADTNDTTDLRTLDDFYAHDHNDIYDSIMTPYLKKLKETNNHDNLI